jgi:hypothetical protein
MEGQRGPLNAEGRYRHMEKMFVTNWTYVRAKEPVECSSQTWRYGKKVCNKLDLCKVKGAY